ncbi:hypothetical protein ACFPYM_22035, partial [Methylobacterium hispanicum]
PAWAGPASRTAPASAVSQRDVRVTGAVMGGLPRTLEKDGTDGALLGAHLDVQKASRLPFTQA